MGNRRGIIISEIKSRFYYKNRYYNIPQKEYYSNEDIMSILSGMGYKFKSVIALNKKLNELGIINKLRNNSWDISHQYDYCIEDIVVFKSRQICWKPQGIDLIINAIEVDKWNLPLFEYNYAYNS